MEVSSNKVVLGEFLGAMQEMIAHNLDMIGQPDETDQRRRIVGAFGLYVLFRRLAPQHVKPDEKFYRQLWELQKQVPVVVLWGGKTPWFPSDFLLQHVPLPCKKLSPKPSNVQVRKRRTETLLRGV